MRVGLHLILIMVLVLGTSACGVRLAYHHLDWLAMRWVNDQVSLDRVQEMTFRDALESKLDWHCHSELPRYVSFLDSAIVTLQAEAVSVGQIESLGEEAAVFGQRLLDRAMPSVVDLFASFDAAQVEEILAGIDERNKEFLEERIEADLAQRRRERVEGMQDRLKRFIGSTSDAQDERLKEWADSLLDVAPRMHRLQSQWRDKLALLLESRQQSDDFGPALVELFQPAGDWPNDFRALMAVNRQRTLALLVDLHAMLSGRQQRRLISRLESLRRDFDRLSCRQDAA